MSRPDESTTRRTVEFNPLPTVNTTQLVQERLIQFMRGNNLRPGDKLPSENDIAKRLGIGRPALREALRSLQALGLIEVRAGSGWYAVDPSLDAVAKHLVFALEPSDQTRKELHRIRGILEGAFLGEAMGKLTPDDFVTLRKLAAKMEILAMAGQSYAEQDRDFHLILFSHVTNDFFHKLVEACWTMTLTWLTLQPATTLDRQILSAGKHRRILDAIVAGDIDTARKLLEIHSIRDCETPGYSEEC